VATVGVSEKRVDKGLPADYATVPALCHAAGRAPVRTRSRAVYRTAPAADTPQAHAIALGRAPRHASRAAGVNPAAAPPPAAGAAPAYARTGARLGWATLAYLACVVVTITLEPFVFRRPAAPGVVWWAADAPWHGWFDVVANVAMFAPLGFVAALARSHRGGRRLSPARAFALGAAASAAIELVQRFEPGRYASPTDVASNAAGAALGAWLCRRLAAQLGVRHAGRRPPRARAAADRPRLRHAAAAHARRAHGGRAPRGAGHAGARARRAGGVRRDAARHAAAAPTRPGRRRAPGDRGRRRRLVRRRRRPGRGDRPGGLRGGRSDRGCGGVVRWARRGTNVRAVERRFEGEAIGRAAPWLACYLRSCR
jgi:VanZ family protein